MFIRVRSVRRAPTAFIGRGGFLKLGHNFYFFQICSDKLRARVAILDLRGPKVYNIFKILKFMLSRLFKIAILELRFHGKRAQILSK